MENKLVVEFELVSALDLQGIMLPRRQVLTSVCTWKYRGADCSYTGPAVATQTDTITTDILLDNTRIRLDLNSDPKFDKFKNVSRVGISCLSQIDSKWFFMKQVQML